MCSLQSSPCGCSGELPSPSPGRKTPTGTPRVPLCDFPVGRVAGLLGRPAKERRDGTDGVYARLLVPHVRGFLGLRTERYDPCVWVVQGHQSLRAFERDFPRPTVAKQDVPERGAVVEQEAAEDGIRRRTGTQRLAPLPGRFPISLFARHLTCEPEFANPVTPRPITLR